jgi:hypothetical protein
MIHVSQIRSLPGWITLAACWLVASVSSAQGPFPGPSGEPLPLADRTAAIEFLESAPLVRWQEIDDGTNPRKRVVTLGRDGVEVRAVFRYMYEHKPGARGFLDSYRSELAAQALAELLGLPNVPPTAARKLKGKRGSLQLWVFGAKSYAELGRKRGDTPDPPALRARLDTMRLFDALIANQDRNPGNILVGDDGRVWWIDHSRSFGGDQRLRGLDAVGGCERSFFAALSGLDEAGIRHHVGPFTPYLDDLLARRRSLLSWIASRATDDPGFLRDADLQL